MATLKIITQNGRGKGYSVSSLGRFAFLGAMVALLLSFGCKKEEVYSDIPSITYLSYKTEKGFSNDNKVWFCTIKFELRDGDGDFGLETPDSTTAPEYRNNLFLKQFNKINGVYIPVPDNAASPLSKPILYFEAEGNNKQQKATISVRFEHFPNPHTLQLPSDTIKYRFYVKDRALHSSDTIETAEIVFDKSQNLW